METSTLTTEKTSYTIPDNDIIFSAIKEIEEKKKKRPDIERICAAVNERHGLAKEDTVDRITKMQREGYLKLKLYDSGPPAYKVNKDFFEEERRKSATAIASDRTCHVEEILTSPLPTAGFQPEQGVNSLLATLDSLARGLDNTNQLLHQERAYSKALLKENYDLKLKIIEYENKNSSLLDDILMGSVGQGAEGDSFGESQDQRGEKGLWQTVRPRRITRTANSNPNNANPNPNNANEPYTSTRGTATAKKHKIKEGKTKQHTHNKQQPRGMENNQNKTTFSKTSGTSRKPIQICMVGDSQLSRMDAQKMSNNHHVIMLNGKSGMKIGGGS